MSDDFTITAFYSEYGISAPAYAQTGNLSTCLNPPQNSEKCFRYMWTITLDQGTVPSCNGTVNGQPFVIGINQFENPNILYNECI